MYYLCITCITCIYPSRICHSFQSIDLRGPLDIINLYPIIKQGLEI